MGENVRLLYLVERETSHGDWVREATFEFISAAKIYALDMAADENRRIRLTEFYSTDYSLIITAKEL